LLNGLTVNKKNNDQAVYLTFDDGPHEKLTKWVLDCLKENDIPATFFLSGNQTSTNPGLVNDILDEHHAVGNHTQSHINGWKSSTVNYLREVKNWENSWCKATGQPPPSLFRPPYGKLTPRQFLALRKKGYQVILWSLMSYDFDHSFSVDKLLEVLVKKTQSGSIIVFHENDKTVNRLPEILPEYIKRIREKGMTFASL